MRWIDPVASAQTSEPSARILARCRPPAPVRIAPGFNRPRSTSVPNGIRGSDFFERVTVLGKPPQVVHVDVGNCSNRVLFQILELNWSSILTALEDGVPLISVARTGLLLFERL